MVIAPGVVRVRQGFRLSFVTAKPSAPFVAGRPGLEKATIAGYRSAFENHILDMIGEEPLSALDVPFVREWVRKRRTRPAKVPVLVKQAPSTASLRSRRTWPGSP